MKYKDESEIVIISVSITLGFEIVLYWINPSSFMLVLLPILEGYWTWKRIVDLQCLKVEKRLFGESYERPKAERWFEKIFRKKR
jgi:hypothetical protein